VTATNTLVQWQKLVAEELDGRGRVFSMISLVNIKMILSSD
jgi:hypothetical protein